MRSATGSRLALTFVLDLRIARGVTATAARTTLITEYHAENGELTRTQRGRLDDGARVTRIAPIKTKNNDTSRKPKELRKWPMLH